MSSADDRTVRSSIEERYRVLLETGRTLTATLSASELYATIHRETARALETAGFCISLYDQGRDLARIVYCAHGDRVLDADVSFRGSDSEVIRSQSASFVGDGASDGALLAVAGEPGRSWGSSMSAPMVHQGRVMGLISVHSRDAGAYAEDDLKLLQGIADIAAIAIDNALKFSEIEQRRREAEQIEEIGRALTSRLESKEVLGKVVQAALDVLDLDGAAVWLCDGPEPALARVAEADGDIRLPLGAVWNIEGELERTLLQDRRPVVLDDLEGNPLVPEHLREQLSGGSAAGVPITVGGQVAGILTAGSRSPRRFGPDETAVLSRLARQSSVALQNALLHENLQALSLTDPLTGLPNRRRLQIHLDQEVAAARRGRALSIVILDIDNFKQINDAYGHLTGDDILRAFGEILVDENRTMNLVARYGGDEFVSVLSESSIEGARQYVERMTHRVRQDEIMARHGVSVSVGVAEFDRTWMKSVEDVLREADLDMYAAKTRRRGDRPNVSA
jgi:diguanylate cyclase (GGDEF)-like protein